MIVRFNEDFPISIDEMYGYFSTPNDWTRIFGFPEGALAMRNGWYRIPLKNSPFPLVAKYVFANPPHEAQWIFRGFWHGEGKIRLTSTDAGVHIEGFEEIAVRPLWLLSPLVEKLFLEKTFQRIWEVGWLRIRQFARVRDLNSGIPSTEP